MAEPQGIKPDRPLEYTPPPPGTPRLRVIRGQNLDQQFPIYEGRNTIGRFADRPVDIDLMSQEAEGQVWSSRLHAEVLYVSGEVLVEDLNSLNGTWLNGVRIHAGQQRALRPGDVLQVGTVQLRLVMEQTSYLPIVRIASQIPSSPAEAEPPT